MKAKQFVPFIINALTRALSQKLNYAPNCRNDTGLGTQCVR